MVRKERKEEWMEEWRVREVLQRPGSAALTTVEVPAKGGECYK